MWYKFNSNSNVICKLKHYSTPGRRIFRNRTKLLYRSHFGAFDSYYVLSTGYGLMSSREALRRGIGGEVLMQVPY